MTKTLLKSWPAVARDVVLDAARHYYRQMKDLFPVPDVLMEQALEWANEELSRRDREIREEASDHWINRWERGKLDAEMTKAIEETYRRLSRAERVLRPRSGARKKSPRHLDAEIAHSLKRR